MESGTVTVEESDQRLAPLGTERSLAYARWAGAVVAAIQAFLFDPGPGARPYLIPATFALAGTLAAANLVLLPFLRRRRVPLPLAASMFTIDIGVIAALVWLYLDDPNATQWVLFMIIQLEAAYRWEMRGAVATAVGASAFYAIVRYRAAQQFGFDFTVDSVTYVTGLTLVQGLVVGGMAAKLRSERDASEELHQASHAMSVGLDRSAILDALAREAARLAGAEIAVLWIPQDDGFVPATAVGLPQEAEPPHVLATDPVFGESSVGEAFRTGVSVCRSNRRTERGAPSVPEAAVLPPVWGSVCSIPIFGEGEPIGVLSCYLASNDPPDPEDLARLDALAALAASAMRNALAYEKERTALETLRSLDRLKDDFLSTISHELRTPLTVVEGFATTLRSRWEELADDRRRDLVNRIEGQASSLHERIRDLLEFSRLRSGEYELQPRTFDVAPLVVETVSRLEPNIAPRPVDVEIPEGTAAFADPSAFVQILENLVVNAARYSAEDARITIRGIETDDGWLELSVIDRGMGIPREEQERVFERFYRGRSEEIRKIRGTGVGLAIVQELTTALGGTVALESDPGEGSTFTVRLPSREETAPGEPARVHDAPTQTPSGASP